MFSLERFRADVAQRRVTTLAVVPDFDPPKDRASGLLSALKSGAVDHLLLEAGKETPRPGVVPYELV